MRQCRARAASHYSSALLGSLRRSLDTALPPERLLHAAPMRLVVSIPQPCRLTQNRVSCSSRSSPWPLSA